MGFFFKKKQYFIHVNTQILVCWMSFYIVNSCVTTIQIKIQDVSSTQKTPSGPSQLVPPTGHHYSDLLLDFM